MSRDKGFVEAEKYFSSMLDDEEIESFIDQKNMERQLLEDRRYHDYAARNSQFPSKDSRPNQKAEAPILPILAPKTSREQARKNIAAFNRGIEAMPKIVDNYVSNTSPRQMIDDGKTVLRESAKSVITNPQDTILDMIPIIGTKRAFNDSRRLNREADEARKRGDLASAEKLEAASALRTLSGMFGGLPYAGLLGRVARSGPNVKYEVPARFQKNPEPDPETVKRALSQGFTQRKANYLGMPYNKEGSHFISQKWLSDKGVPRWLIDSPLNLVKGRDMSIGDFYEYHYKVDPRFNGTQLPWRSAVGGGQWKGGEIGLQKYGMAERLWHRSPTPLKFTVASPVAIGGVLHWLDDEEN